MKDEEFYGKDHEDRRDEKKLKNPFKMVTLSFESLKGLEINEPLFVKKEIVTPSADQEYGPDKTIEPN